MSANDEKVINLLKLVVSKLQDVYNSLSQTDQRITKLERTVEQVVAKQSEPTPILTSRKIQVEQERARLIFQEDYQHIDYEAEKEPRLREEFKIFVDSSNPRLQSISNTSSPDYADFVLMDSQKIDVLSIVDKNKVVVILSNTDNPAKYSNFNVIKDNYTERQIYKVLSILFQNRLALQNFQNANIRMMGGMER